MARLLGIDLGTTKIAAIVIDSTTGRTVASAASPNESRLPAGEGLSEWDAERAIDLALGVGAEAFHDLYGQMPAAGLTPRKRLIGVGSGIRRNPVLAEILSATFGVPLVTPVHTEEAAYGAALLAAVGTGALPGPAEAGRLIIYN